MTILEKIIIAGMISFALLVVIFAPHNASREQQFYTDCDSGNTFRMGRGEAAACSARLLQRGKK